MQFVVALVFTVAVGCASRPRVAPQPATLAGVSITFVIFGAAVDPLNQRMAESGQMGETTQPGADYWLRLENRSGDAISFQTMSTYVTQPIEWVDVGDENESLR